MLFTETVTLSLIGGILGILGAGVGLEWLASHTTLPLLLESGRVDLGIVLFGLLVSLLTGVAFGLGAVLTARRAGLADLLRSSGGRPATRGRLDGNGACWSVPKPPSAWCSWWEPHS